MGYGCSSFIIKWVSFLTLGVSFCILGMGIWLSTAHGDCDKFLTVPVLIVGAFIFIISLLGFVGAWKNLYLVIMFFLLAGLVLFTAFAFVVTNEGAGRAISGKGFKEYSLGDYSGYIRRLFNNPRNWKHLRDCLLHPDYCAEIARDYASIAELASAQLNAVQSGCCRPPAECKFPMINVTHYDLTSRYIRKPVPISYTTTSSNSTSINSSSIPPPGHLVTVQDTAMINLTETPVPQLRVSTVTTTDVPSDLDATVLPTTVAHQSQYRKYEDPDCFTYGNDPGTMCFQCNACKAGVAQFIKKNWRLVAMINIAVTLFLVALYAVGCCARRNASRSQYTKKLKQREVETENIRQSRPNRSPLISSGRLSAASHDEELGIETQVRCWQTRAPGEPEDLIPIQSICPMRAPWRTTSPLSGSRKRPRTPKLRGKKKLPRLEGQTMVPGDVPRTGEKEQLEHPLLPFGARGTVTVLNYEDSKRREEKLLEQLPPASAADKPTTSHVSPALQTDIPSIPDWFSTNGGGKTPPREIQVVREMSEENETEHKDSPTDGQSKKRQESKEGKSNLVPATLWDPLGVFWRPKSTPVVHQNALFDLDRKKRHNNALFEEEAAARVDQGPESSDKPERQAAPEANNRKGWRKFTHVHNAGETTLLDESAEPGEGKDTERSYKVEMPSYSDVIVELLDDVPEDSECVQDHLKELGGIRIHVRDSVRKIVSWGYDESEDLEKTQRLQELAGFHIHVKDSESKEVSRGHDVSEKCVQEDLKEPEGLHIHVNTSARRLVSRVNRMSDDSVQAQLKESERLRTSVRDSERGNVSRSDDVSEGSLQKGLKGPEILSVHVRDSERRTVTMHDSLSRVQAGLKEPTALQINVKDSKKKKVSWSDDVSGGSVKGQLNKSVGPRIHLADSERRIHARGDDTSEGNVQEDFKGFGGLHIHVRESQRRIISRGDDGQVESLQELGEPEELSRHVEALEKEKVSWGEHESKESVEEELKEPGRVYIHVGESEKRIVSKYDDRTEESSQEELKESGELHIHVREPGRKPVPRGDAGSAKVVRDELKGLGRRPGHTSDPQKKRISWVEDESKENVPEELEESGGLYIPIRKSESGVCSRGDDQTEESIQEEHKEPAGLYFHARESERRIVSRGDDFPEENVQKQLKEPLEFSHHMQDTEKKRVSWGDDESKERVQEELKEPGGLHTQITESESRIVPMDDDRPEDRLQGEIKPSEGIHLHVREFKRRLVSRSGDRLEESVQKELEESWGLHIQVSEYERRIVSRGDDKREESVEEGLKESGVLRVCMRDTETRTTSRGDLVSAENVQEELNKGSNGFRIHVRDCARKIVSTGDVVSEDNRSVQTEHKESSGLPFHVTDSGRIIVPRDDPERDTQTYKKEKEHTGLDVPKNPRESKRGLEAAGEGGEEQLLCLKKEELRETTPSVNYHFAVPKLSRAINPILGHVKEKKLKSADEEIRKKGVSRYVFDPPKICRSQLEEQGEPPRKSEQERPPKTVVAEPGPLPKLEDISTITDFVKRIRPKSAEKTQAKPEENPLENSSVRPQPGSFTVAQRNAVEESQPALKEKSPRATPFKEPYRTLAGEALTNLEEEHRASFFKEPRLKLKQIPPRVIPFNEPQQKLVGEPRPELEERPAGASSYKEPQRKSVEEPKAEKRTPRASSFHEPQQKSAGEEPPWASSSNEPRQRFEERPRTSSFQEPRLTVQARPPRPKSTFDHRSEPVAEPQPTMTREGRNKYVEETQPSLVEETLPNSGDEPRPTLGGAQRPKSVEEAWPSLMREPRSKSVEEPRQTILAEPRPKYVEEHRPKPIDEELHHLDTFERGESSTSRKSRRRKRKPKKPDY